MAQFAPEVTSLHRTLRAALTVLLLAPAAARAQEMEPRAYSPSPVGTNFAVFVFTHTAGSVVVDPSLPVTDIHATTNVNAIGLGHVFDLFGRQALIAGAIPYAVADVTGNVGGNAREIQRSGLTDSNLKLSVLLLGGKALTPREFAATKHGAVMGVSLGIQAPTGQYYPQYLINIGTNRWAVRPEAGISYPRGRWVVEGAFAMTLFANNDSYYPGQALKSQQPVKALQAHVSYTIQPRMWLAFDATWYTGGRVDVNDVQGAQFQRNSRAGATFALPIGRKQSLKVAYNTGTSTRFGGDFNAVSVAYQMVWFGSRSLLTPSPPPHAP